VIAGIILAAGASRRMGSPKALLEYRGETFADRLIRVFSTACDPVIMVLGHHAETIRKTVRGAHIVVNPDPERGQLSSLQTALAEVPADAEGFLFAPVDCPAMEPATLCQLVDVFRQRDPATVLVVPSYHGRHGHPICAAPSLIRELLALPPTAQAREVVHLHVAHTQYVDVDDPGILADIDNPEEYRRLVGGVR